MLRRGNTKDGNERCTPTEMRQFWERTTKQAKIQCAKRVH